MLLFMDTLPDAHAGVLSDTLLYCLLVLCTLLHTPLLPNIQHMWACIHIRAAYVRALSWAQVT